MYFKIHFAKGKCCYTSGNVNAIIWREFSISKDFKQTSNCSIGMVSEVESHKTIYKDSQENDGDKFMVIPQNTISTNTITMKTICTVGDKDISLTKELIYDET